MAELQYKHMDIYLREVLCPGIRSPGKDASRAKVKSDTEWAPRGALATQLLNLNSAL